jgi:hypothetical protein
MTSRAGKVRERLILLVPSRIIGDIICPEQSEVNKNILDVNGILLGPETEGRHLDLLQFAPIKSLAILTTGESQHSTPLYITGFCFVVCLIRSLACPSRVGGRSNLPTFCWPLIKRESPTNFIVAGLTTIFKSTASSGVGLHVASRINFRHAICR